MEDQKENPEELSFLKGLSILDQARDYPPKGWVKVFQKADSDLEFISEKLSNRGVYYPEEQYLFAAFRLCPLKDVRVVILGQDPYPRKKDAKGLSFSTGTRGSVAPSLRNIFKEIQRTYPDFEIPQDGDLMPWVEQGVFLLNTCLTYHPDEPLKNGDLNVWMPFIRHVISAICKKNPNAVFVLWGEKAKQIKKYIKGCKIIEGRHPSPLGGNGFIGCGHFLEINQYLAANGLEEIKWSLC